MGFDAIEFTDLPCETQQERLALARQLRLLASEKGITVCAYAVSANLAIPDEDVRDREVQRIFSQLDVAAALGCTVMRHDVCHNLLPVGKFRSFGMMLPSIADCCRRVAEYGQTLGIKTCVENHGYIAQDSYRLEMLFDAVAHDNFGLLVDIANFVCADEDCPTSVSRLAPYAVHVHAKDMHLSKSRKEGYGQTRGCNYFKGAILGEGDVYAGKSLAILKKAGYDGYYSIEFEGSEDCIEAVGKSRENLLQMLSL